MPTQRALVTGFVASLFVAGLALWGHHAAGQDAVRDVLQHTLAQFQDRQTGVVTLVNTFRWVAARNTRPPSTISSARSHA